MLFVFDNDCKKLKNYKGKKFFELDWNEKEKVLIENLFEEPFEDLKGSHFYVPDGVVKALKNKTFSSSNKEDEIWFEFFKLVQEKLKENECCQFYLYEDELPFVDEQEMNICLLSVEKQTIKLYSLDFVIGKEF